MQEAKPDNAGVHVPPPFVYVMAIGLGGYALRGAVLASGWVPGEQADQIWLRVDAFEPDQAASLRR